MGLAPFMAITAFRASAACRAARNGASSTFSRGRARNFAISPECGVATILPACPPATSRTLSVAKADASRTKTAVFRRFSNSDVSSATAVSSIMPGPISTASEPDASSIKRGAFAGSIPPAGVSRHPTTIASGIAIARWEAADWHDAIWSIPAPARNTPSPARRAAPGISTLPAITRTRPLACLSPSCSCFGSGCVRRNSGVTATGLIVRLRSHREWM
jgi:hypothetical protein